MGNIVAVAAILLVAQPLVARTPVGSTARTMSTPPAGALEGRIIGKFQPKLSTGQVRDIAIQATGSQVPGLVVQDVVVTSTNIVSVLVHNTLPTPSAKATLYVELKSPPKPPSGSDGLTVGGVKVNAGSPNLGLGVLDRMKIETLGVVEGGKNRIVPLDFSNFTQKLTFCGPGADAATQPNCIAADDQLIVTVQIVPGY